MILSRGLHFERISKEVSIGFLLTYQNHRVQKSGRSGHVGGPAQTDSSLHRLEKVQKSACIKVVTEAMQKAKSK